MRVKGGEGNKGKADILDSTASHGDQNQAKPDGVTPAKNTGKRKRMSTRARTAKK